MSIVLTGRAKQNGGCDQACRTTAARDEIAPAEGSITPATKRAKLWDSDYTSDIAATITPEASCHGPAAAKEESPSTAHCCGTSEQETKDLLLREAGYDVDSSAAVPKRTDYLTWDDYFMATTVLSSLRSKDPTNPSGCCIVDSRNRIIGIGYNGFPMHCSDDVLPWTPASSDTAFLHTCDPFVCHAEINAVLCSGDVKGARLFVSDFPCNECAKVIIQAGISEVVYQNETRQNEQHSESVTASQILFKMAGVKIRAFSATQKKVELVRTSHAQADATDGAQNTPGPTEEVCLDHHRQLMREEADYEPKASTKRNDFLSWDDYFMWVAFLTAKRSKDPSTQVGACLVLNRRIVGLGYNGFPLGCSDDCLPWARHSAGVSPLHTKYPYVVHAEKNTILNSIFSDVRGASLYVDLFPCNECAKFIVQAGIREVVYLDDKYHESDSCKASRILFGMAGVKLRQHTPTRVSLLLRLGP